MHRWEVVIPAVSIVRAVPVMPPPSLVRADPSHSASLPPLSAVVHHSCTPDAASSAKKTGRNRTLSPKADRARDEAAPYRVRRYLLFAPIAFLQMRSGNGGGADSDENSNATNIWNRHIATSTQRARRGSGTCSTPNVNVFRARHLTGEVTRR
jgi:hypothetical protein